MLESLHIRNLALVTELDIEFGSGFNVVTGETGAGKSLIIGALQILLGERTPKSVIRHGADRCEIAAMLTLNRQYPELCSAIESILEISGIPACEDNTLLLRRIITSNSNKVYINSTPATLRVLADLGELLIDIHGPQTNYSLLRSGCQRELLDRYAGVAGDVRACAATYRKITELTQQLDDILQDEPSPAEQEVLRHQLNEIQQAELRSGEDRELNERYDLLANARSIMEAASQVQMALSEGDESVCERLAPVVRLVGEIETMDPERGTAFRERLEAVVDQLQDISMDLTAYAEQLDLDSAELQQLEDRLDLVQRLKRRYGGTVEDVLEYADSLQQRLDRYESRNDTIETLRKECGKFRRQLEEQCARLSEIRRKNSSELADKISQVLRRLGFLNSRFEIGLTQCEPGPTGGDAVEFRFAPNPGEPPKPLKEIASSGEIARTMLAVKSVLTAADNVPILIFDEIDANVGGRIALNVAQELAAIGRRHQTLCISHLPQIAAAASTHFLVRKDVTDDKTVTRMHALDEKTRITEIARMLGGAEESSVARRHAQEMLEKSRECCCA